MEREGGCWHSNWSQRVGHDPATSFQFTVTIGVSQVVLVVKIPPAMQELQETQVQFLGLEDPLGEGMARQSSILAWRIPGTQKPCGLQSIGSQRV